MSSGYPGNAKPPRPATLTDQTVNGRTALITGASRGFGRAAAISLARCGYHVIAIARTIGALEELDDEIRSIGGGMSIACLDIGDDSALAGMVKTLAERGKMLDVVIHAAVHSSPLTPASQIDCGEIDRALLVNVRATARLISCLAPMLNRDGVFVFLEDLRCDGKFYGTYGSTKSAQINLARCWQRETVRTGPRVVIFQPVPMYTRTLLRFHPGASPNDHATPETEVARLLTQIDTTNR